MTYLLDSPRLDQLATAFLRKYGRSEAHDHLHMLLMAERERALRDAVKDVCAWLRMPDEEYDRTHADATAIAHKTADAIAGRYLRGTRIARLLRWDSTTHPIPVAMGGEDETKASG